MSEYESEIDELQSDTETNERWRVSEPPPDPWGDVDGADAEGNWRFQIIGEEVDYEGDVWHEVRWDDWHRADGTKTTWESFQHGGINSSQWTRQQRRRRRSLAAETLAIELPTTTDIHNDATHLRNEAYEEKLLRVKKEPQPNLVVEMSRLLAKHQAHIYPQGMGTGHGQGALPSDSPLRSSQRTSTRQHTLNSITSSSTPAARGSSNTSSQSVVPKPSSATASSSKSQTTSTLSSAPASTNSRAGPSVVVSSSSANKPAQRSVIVNPSTPQSLPASRSTAVVSQKSSQSNHYSKVEDSSTPSTSIDKGKRRMMDLDTDVLPTPKDTVSLPRKRVKRPADSSGSTNAPEAAHLQSPSTVMHPTASSSTPKTKTTPSITLVHNATPLEENPQIQRKKLGNAWTFEAKARGGERITFFNDVDDEAIPPVSASFRYLECSYLFAKGIDRPDSGFLLSCSCDVCGPQPATCSCQDDWEQQNFAYTPSGLYAFNVPKNIEVIECNKLCECSIKCMNRVSQRPRDVPIQIFKTHNRGWGVRAMVPLKRGKVVGIYTGRLIRRETSRALPADLASYCFDLDGDEMVDNNQSQTTQGMQGKYSVDSRREGNWTRFINHSCSPNLEIYLVVHDRPAGSGMPYIAFVANQTVPAYTELAFDYHPEVAAQIAMEKFKAKGKQVKLHIPEGAKECLCEAAECRGYLA